MSKTIHFFNEDIDFSIEDDALVCSWILEIAAQHNRTISQINYVFCSDEYLLDINKTHLNHNYYTDIITFDMSEENEEDIESDVFISIDRVKENAITNEVLFNDELNRVIIHGLLHLIGYDDKTEEEKLIMRKKEDACLSLLLEN